MLPVIARIFRNHASAMKGMQKVITLFFYETY